MRASSAAGHAYRLTVRYFSTIRRMKENTYDHRPPPMITLQRPLEHLQSVMWVIVMLEQRSVRLESDRIQGRPQLSFIM